MERLTNIMAGIRRKAVERLRSKVGMSLSEVLVATLIASLVALLLATGVGFAVKSYNKSIDASESRALCSTLQSRISDELRFATVEEATAFSKDGKTHYDVAKLWISDVGYTSDYVCLNADGAPITQNYGYLALPYTDRDGVSRYYKLLPNSEYSRGMKARVSVDCYSEANDADDVRFAVELEVVDSKGGTLNSVSFEVIPLNSNSFN